MRRLRAYSNYLSPAVGLSGDLMTLVAIFVRNLFLHWLVLLPALLAVLMLPRVYLALLGSSPAALPLGSTLPWIALLVATLLYLLALMAGARDKPAPWLTLSGWAVVGLAFLGLVSATPVASGQVLFALAVLGVLLSTAYMAADLPETAPPRQGEPAPTAAPNRFRLCNHLPLAAASLLFSLLAPWLTDARTLSATADLWPVVLVPAGPAVRVAIAYAAGFAGLHFIAASNGVEWRERRGLQPRSSAFWPERGVNLVVGAIGGLALLKSMTLLSGLCTPHGGSSQAPPSGADAFACREVYAIVAAPAMMGVFWLTVTIYAGLTRSWKSEEDREWWARAAGYWLLGAVAWGALALAGLLLPRLLLAVPDMLGFETVGSGTLTGGAALLGVLSSVWGYWSRNGDKLVGQVRGMLARLKARLLDVLSVVFIVLLAAVLGLALSRMLEWIDGEGQPAANGASAASAAPAAFDASTGGAAARKRRVEELLATEFASARLAERCAKAAATSACRSGRRAGKRDRSRSRSRPPRLPALMPPRPLRDRAVPAPTASPPTADCPPPGPSDAQHAAMTFRVLLHTTGLATAAWVFAGLVGFALLMARLIGTNTFSLHSMYGNRLTRAYLGASNPHLERRPHPFTGFDPADNVELAALAAGCAGTGGTGPPTRRRGGRSWSSTPR